MHAAIGAKHEMVGKDFKWGLGSHGPPAGDGSGNHTSGVVKGAKQSLSWVAEPFSKWGAQVQIKKIIAKFVV